MDGKVNQGENIVMLDHSDHAFRTLKHKKKHGMLLKLTHSKPLLGLRVTNFKVYTPDCFKYNKTSRNILLHPEDYPDGMLMAS